MTKIKILKDGVKGADDGATVREYPKNGGPDKNGTYVVSESLALVMIEAGEADEVPGPSVSDKARDKAERKAAAEKAAAEKAAADKAAAEKAALTPGLPPIPGKK